MIEVYDLTTEYSRMPNAVDALNPRFGWKIRSDNKGVMQKSYRIQAVSGYEILWDSGVVESDECRFIRYEGQSLQSRQKVTWQVTVTAEDHEGNILTAERQKAGFQMGLLHEADWVGKWITAGEDTSSPRPAVYLRRSFYVKPGLVEARIYQTAHGLYESFINGQITDNDKFKPGLTSYYCRIQYQTYDITDLLHEGENSWNVTLADGWWRGCTGGSVINNWGRSLDYLGQIELIYADGEIEVVGTDEAFEMAQGPLKASDMLMGDIYDARLECANWQPVRLLEGDPVLSGLTAKRIASRSVPVREMERFDAKPFRDRSGALILDFGQNIAGYVRMVLRNTKPGQIVKLIHGETLDHNGNFTIANVNKTTMPVSAFQEVTYICRGVEEEIYQPFSAIFGFRYVKIEGYEGEILTGDFTAIAVYSTMEETGDFTCSNDLINKLVSNSIWSQKGNFMDVPVDCPTRERNAWTGDAQIYVRAACTFMNAYLFYEKWLQDQTMEQYASGKVGITFPSTSSVHHPGEVANMKQVNPQYEIAGPSGDGNKGEDATGWGDSAAWLPWSVYQWYGDPQILENQYETARKWLEFELRCAKDPNPLYAELPQYKDGFGEYIFDTRFHYGEWNEAFGIREKVAEYYKNPPVSIEQTPEDKLKIAAMVNYFIEMKAKEGDAVTATAYMARTAQNLADMATVLGKSEDATHYAVIAKTIREVYAKYLIAEDGTIQPGHQAPYVRALMMDLCGDKKDAVIKQLLKEIEANDYCLNTGFLSTPFLLPVLADNGYADVAYLILENEELPGWLYPVKKGLTTIPESWGGVDLLEDSLNHYSYGAVCEFLFQYIAGIRPDAPGWKHFILKPIPGGSLTHAEATQVTPYGAVRSAWKIEEGAFRYECTVPANTTAALTLPNGDAHHLGSGTYQFSISHEHNKERRHI